MNYCKKTLTLLIVAITSVTAVSAQYKINFSRIVCLNPWNNKIPSKAWDIVEPVLAKFPGMKEKQTGWYGESYIFNDKTLYYENMSLDKYPDGLMNESRFLSEAGSSKDLLNDKFYMTYKDQARQGMVLPVQGGDANLFRFAFWRPTAKDGNPALAGQDSITYYLWEADVVSKDNKLGSFTINLKEKKGKGPQLVLVVRGYANNGGNHSAIYLIEYDVN